MKVESARDAYQLVMTNTEVVTEKSLISKRVDTNGEYFVVCPDPFYEGAPAYAVKVGTGEVEVWSGDNTQATIFYAGQFKELQVA